MPISSAEKDEIHNEIEGLHNKLRAELPKMKTWQEYESVRATALKLGKLYWQLADYNHACEFYELAINTRQSSTQEGYIESEKPLFAKADMLRQLGFLAESSDLYRLLKDRYAWRIANPINKLVAKWVSLVAGEVPNLDRILYKCALQGLAKVYLALDEFGAPQNARQLAVQYLDEASQMPEPSPNTVFNLYDHRNVATSFIEQNKSNDASNLLVRARLAEREGNIGTALTSYLSIISLEKPDIISIVASLRLGNFYARNNAIEEAFKYYNQAIDQVLYNLEEPLIDIASFTDELSSSLRKYIALLESHEKTPKRLHAHYREITRLLDTVQTWLYEKDPRLAFNWIEDQIKNDGLYKNVANWILHSQVRMDDTSKLMKILLEFPISRLDAQSAPEFLEIVLSLCQFAGYRTSVMDQQIMGVIEKIIALNRAGASSDNNDSNLPLRDATYWYRRAASVGNEAARQKYQQLFEERLGSAPDLLERLENVMSQPFSPEIVLFPISLPITLKVTENGQEIEKKYANTYENSEEVRALLVSDFMGLHAVKDIVTSQDIPRIWENGRHRKDIIGILADFAIPNKMIADLGEYILRSQGPIDIASFPGFINQNTGKRFVNPHLTKTGETVEEGNPDAYCVNSMAIAVMKEFPNLAAEYLQEAVAQKKAGHEQESLIYIIKGLKQAEIEKNNKIRKEFLSMLGQYVTMPKEAEKKTSTAMLFSQSSDVNTQDMLDGFFAKDIYEIIMCPITMGVPWQPVTLKATGNTFEAYALLAAIRRDNKDPFTGQVLSDNSVIPNKAIETLVAYIILQAHRGESVDLSTLPIFFDANKNLFKDPYLTVEGETVEKDDSRAVTPNRQLKHLIEKFATPEPDAAHKLQ